MSKLFKRSWWVALALALGVCVAASVAGAQPRRIAVVIGNNHYQSIGSLSNAVHDAQEMGSCLRGLGFSVTPVLDGTASAMRSAVTQAAASLRPGDTILLFYSGHGTAIAGVNHLLGVDARFTDDDSSVLGTLPLEAVLSTLAARRVTAVLIFDACRNDPFRGQTRPAQPVETGFREMVSPPGALLVFSTQPGNVASDGLPGTHSPFTAALLRFIGRPGEEIRDIVTLVRREVMGRTGRRQVPWDHSSLTSRLRLTEARSTLPAQACSLEGTIRSYESGSASVLRWVNRSRRSYRVVWLDSAGRRRPHNSMNGLAQTTQRTSAGQAWMLTDEDDRCVGIYQATEGESSVLIDE